MGFGIVAALPSDREVQKKGCGTPVRATYWAGHFSSQSKAFSKQIAARR
jgi:hypothetical protein